MQCRVVADVGYKIKYGDLKFSWISSQSRHKKSNQLCFNVFTFSVEFWFY